MEFAVAIALLARTKTRLESVLAWLVQMTHTRRTLPRRRKIRACPALHTLTHRITEADWMIARASQVTQAATVQSAPRAEQESSN